LVVNVRTYTPAVLIVMRPVLTDVECMLSVSCASELKRTGFRNPASGTDWVVLWNTRQVGGFARKSAAALRLLA
jgi:hypothetical protein